MSFINILIRKIQQTIGLFSKTDIEVHLKKKHKKKQTKNINKISLAKNT